ncbi:MAG: homocysteine S-methyltransferase family protein [Geminicoccaceae bacterium]
MARYRSALPQLAGDIFLMDGGMETTLVFHQGFDLPHFAAFDLLRDEEGRKALRSYYDDYVPLAKSRAAGFILESVTWRANPDWGRKLGYSSEGVAAANRLAITMLEDVRRAYEQDGTTIVISGCVGPRGDGYNPREIMSEFEAEWYHRQQIQTLADTAADMISAMTITNIPEAIGIARAAKANGMPVVISFTVETDGRLPTGDGLGDAIQAVDAATDNGPAYYMINCAHPTHFEDVLATSMPWMKRVRALRANASTSSHAELDEATELDDGSPEELGGQYRDLRRLMPWLNVLGGCCGTDHRHIAAVTEACCDHLPSDIDSAA